MSFGDCAALPVALLFVRFGFGGVETRLDEERVAVDDPRLSHPSFEFRCGFLMGDEL